MINIKLNDKKLEKGIILKWKRKVIKELLY